jgi:GntR family transcriptional regulator of gluconate operon
VISALNADAVQSEALWQRVVGIMRRAIVFGELEPGMHLKEPSLAQRFGVSRLPIREALTQLEREGLVRVEPRRGAYVVGVTLKDISDIYECRQMLECWAIRHTAVRIDEQGLAALTALIEQMDAGFAAGQVQRVAASDMAFHRLLIDLSRNRALSISWEPLTPLIETALSIAETTVPDLPAAIDGHRQILCVLQQHDKDAACMLLQEHLRGGEQLVHAAVSQARAGLHSG